MVKKIDLHIHTNCSDGNLNPFEVIDDAVKNNLDTIAIADHDTLSAYTDDLYEYAKNKKINIINAVEISTKINKCGIHVLGYNVDINDKELNAKLEKLRNARHDYLYNVGNKLIDLGYDVNIIELNKIDAVTKAHIALDVINNKNNQELLLKEFDHIPSKGEFIETIMNEGCPAYVKKESISPKEAACLIRKAGGKVVLAHPVAYTYEDNLTINDIKELITDMDVDGIEAYYIYIDRNNNKHNDIKKWIDFSKANKKFVTIGSDFHNKDGIHPTIGFLNEDLNVSSKEIDEILNNLNY